MITFDYELDNPVEFDAKALCFLAELYRSDISAHLLNCRGEDPLLNAKFEGLHADTCNNEILIRFIISGYAVADALGLSKAYTKPIVNNFCLYRVIPVSILDRHIDNFISPRDAIRDSRSIQLVSTAGLSLILCQIDGEKDAKTHSIMKFWNIHKMYFHRIVRAAYEDIGRRFDLEVLRYPERMMARYNTKHSPLLRSSTIETLMHGMSCQYNIDIGNIDWIIRFEEARQILDDVSDLREDLLSGRITQPALLALCDKKSGEKLVNILKDLWTDFKAEEKYAQDAFNLIVASGAVTTATNMAKEHISFVQSQLDRQRFPGDILPLRMIFDLKYAFAKRLELNNYSDPGSSFTF